METQLHIPYEELPLWMRRARRRVDWGLLFIAALSLCVGWTFYQQPDLPTYSANLNYAFRAADTADALREGRLYPRWSPHALGGYGAPIPHYYPPGAPYLVALVEVLFTNDTIPAMRIVYIAALIIAGTSLYAVVGRWTNAGGGMIATLLYVFSPYLGFVAPYVSGDLPVVVAMALTPMLLWAINRLLLLNTPTDFVLITVITAVLLLTEPHIWIMSIILGTMVWLASPHRKRGAVISAALILGTILAALYWLPALSEYNAVRWTSPEIPPLSYTLDLNTLFLPLMQNDPAELAPAPQLTLGWLLRLFILLALISISLHRKKEQVYPALFLGFGFLLMIGVVILAPQAAWVLGVLSLCFAIAGSAALQFERNLPVGLQRLLLPIMLAVILIGSINVWLGASRLPGITSVEPMDQIRYEQQGLGVAVLPPGSPVPSTLSPGTDSNLSLVSSYQYIATISSGIDRCKLCPLEKVAPLQISRSGQINVVSQETHSAQYQVRTLGDCATNPQSNPNCRLDQPVIMNWQTAYFPGWKAWLDDLSLDLRPNGQTGLIDIRIPRVREGDLFILLDSTPVRDAGCLLSLLAGFIMLIVLRHRLRHYEEPDLDFALLSPEQSRLVAVVILSFGVIFALSNSLPLRALPNSGLANLTPMNIQTDVGLQLLGYRLLQSRYRPSETLEVMLYWRALRPLPANYRVRVYLRDAARSLDWLEQPLRDPAGFPTRRWITSGYVKDSYQLNLPQDIFAGNYQIALEAYSCDSQCTGTNRLTFFNPADREPEKLILLPTVITIAAS